MAFVQLFLLTEGVSADALVSFRKDPFLIFVTVLSDSSVARRLGEPFELIAEQA